MPCTAKNANDGGIVLTTNTVPRCYCRNSHFISWKFSPIIIHKFTRLSELLLHSLSAIPALDHSLIHFTWKLSSEHLIIRAIRYISFDLRGRFMILGISVAFITRVQRDTHSTAQYTINSSTRFCLESFSIGNSIHGMVFFIWKTLRDPSVFFCFLRFWLAERERERNWVNDCERKAI